MHSGLKGETKGFSVAAQDQALNTRYICKHIMNQGLTDKCRMCYSSPETVKDILFGYKSLAVEKYLNRHSQAVGQLHLNVCKYYHIKLDVQYWYEHKPDRLIENDKVTVLWDSQMITDRHIPVINQIK